MSSALPEWNAGGKKRCYAGQIAHRPCVMQNKWCAWRCLHVADVQFNFWCRAVTHQRLHNVQSVFPIKCTAEDLDLVPRRALRGGCLLLLRGGRGRTLPANFTVHTPPALRLAVLCYSGLQSLFDFFLRLPSKWKTASGEVGVFRVNHHLDGVCVKIVELLLLLLLLLARRETTAK